MCGAPEKIMEITLTTPALLFPAISLLLVAYSNRFLALAARIRSLHAIFKDNRDQDLFGQIQSLRKRVGLIKLMQACGVASLFLCVFCMFTLFAGKIFIGKIVFGVSLFLLMTSLGISLREILVSLDALDLELQNIEKESKVYNVRHK